MKCFLASSILESLIGREFSHRIIEISGNDEGEAGS